MTYQQAYDKIIEAYFKDEMEPYEPCFCFCGNLCDKTIHWYIGCAPNDTHNASHGYSGRELFLMETALLTHVNPAPYPKYEDDLFKGMTAALEVLKDIHRSRGEDVDGVKVFTKRVLTQ